MASCSTTWQLLRDLFSPASFSPSSSSSSSNNDSYSQYSYDRLAQDDMAGPEEANGAVDVVAVNSAGESSRPGADVDTDATLARRVLHKIDRRLIPLLFVTYMLNFMDKTILSSASVFGLQDDTVCQRSPP